MKILQRAFIAIILSVFFVINGFSQSTFTRYSEFGLKASGYAINQTMKDSYSELLFYGSTIGARFLHVEQKNLGIIVEALYNRQMYNGNEGLFVNDFIQIPLLTHFCFSAKKTSIAINVGPYILPVLSKSSELIIDPDIFYGIAGGLNISYPIKNIILGFEARYNFNLPANENDYGSKTIRNTWVDFGIIISHRIYKK